MESAAVTRARYLTHLTAAYSVSEDAGQLPIPSSGFNHAAAMVMKAIHW